MNHPIKSKTDLIIDPEIELICWFNVRIFFAAFIQTYQQANSGVIMLKRSDIHGFAITNPFSLLIN